MHWHDLKNLIKIKPPEVDQPLVTAGVVEAEGLLGILHIGLCGVGNPIKALAFLQHVGRNRRVGHGRIRRFARRNVDAVPARLAGRRACIGAAALNQHNAQPPALLFS